MQFGESNASEHGYVDNYQQSCQRGNVKLESDIRRIGPFWDFFHQFAVGIQGTCPNEERGWQLVLVKGADQLGIRIFGVKRRELLAARTRADMKC